MTQQMSEKNENFHIFCRFAMRGGVIKIIIKQSLAKLKLTFGALILCISWEDVGHVRRGRTCVTFPFDSIVIVCCTLKMMKRDEGFEINLIY